MFSRSRSFHIICSIILLGQDYWKKPSCGLLSGCCGNTPFGWLTGLIRIPGRFVFFFLSHIIAVVALALLLSWPYHISLLTMNILVTSVFIFVIVFDMLFPDKGFKIKWKSQTKFNPSLTFHYCWWLLFFRVFVPVFGLCSIRFNPCCKFRIWFVYSYAFFGDREFANWHIESKWH